VEREVRLARVEMLRAALSALAEARRDDELSDLLRRRYDLRLRLAEADPSRDGDGSQQPIAPRGGVPSDGATIVRTALSAERQRILALRANGTIGDTAFQQLERELDFEELYLQHVVPGAGPVEAS